MGAALLVGALTPVPATVTCWSIALAFGVSAAVGILFGVVPAQRAGRLDPVVALRSESPRSSRPSAFGMRVDAWQLPRHYG